jgi:hypothetical protein
MAPSLWEGTGERGKEKVDRPACVPSAGASSFTKDLDTPSPNIPRLWQVDLLQLFCGFLMSQEEKRRGIDTAVNVACHLPHLTSSSLPPPLPLPLPLPPSPRLSRRWPPLTTSTGNCKHESSNRPPSQHHRFTSVPAPSLLATHARTPVATRVVL